MARRPLSGASSHQMRARPAPPPLDAHASSLLPSWCQPSMGSRGRRRKPRRHKRSSRTAVPALWTAALSVVAVEDSADGADPLLQLGRMLLAHDTRLLPGGMHDLAALERDRDVIAVADQVTRPNRAQRNLAAGLFVHTGVARQ